MSGRPPGAGESRRNGPDPRTGSEEIQPAASPKSGIFSKGPRSRRRELYSVLTIVWEFIRGFRTLHFVGPVRHRLRFGPFHAETHPYYAARPTGWARLAKLGFTVMTGGGPGIMEAANRGAKEAGGDVGRLQHRAADGAEDQRLPRPHA